LRAFGKLRIGVEGIVEKLLEIPAEILQQVAVGPAFDLNAVRWREGDGAGCLTVRPRDPEFVLTVMADNQGMGHERDRSSFPATWVDIT
jgi:hypothetical protein